MKDRRYLSVKTGAILVMLLLCLCLNVKAAPSVKGDTKLTAATDEVVTAEYTITNDEDMESVSLTISYDKSVLTYMSGSGGNSFMGNGGNGSVQLSSKPGSRSASFAVKFKGRSEGDTSLEILACTITVNGQEVDALAGQSASVGEPSDDENDEDGENSGQEESASWVIDGRTFYLHRPGAIEGYEAMKIDIQGIRSRVMKHNDLDLYVVMLFSDNGSYRDYFVYNPDTGNVIPFVEMESGTDHVTFIEPEENIHIPTRYVSVDMGWGPKYTIPAYKHVIIDGIDEFLDDTNRYLVYGINQDGEKAWYSYDYDKNSLQLFDDVAYQGEQNYILSLEESVEGQKSEASHLLKQYNTDMGRRLTIILIMTIMIIVLLNVVVILYLRMKKMRMSGTEEMEYKPENRREGPMEAYVTKDLEEDETDFQESLPEDGEEETDEIELEFIDLDELEDED